MTHLTKRHPEVGKVDWDNPEEVRKYKAEWYQTHRTRMRELQAQYYQDNAEKLRLYQVTYKIEFPEKLSRTNYKKRLKSRYGLTIEAYQDILDFQNGTCAICHQPETAKNSKGGTKTLAVDHDHETGEVRGLLCDNCNLGLGRFSDSIDLLESAISYLRSKR